MIFLLAFEISRVAVQRMNQNSKKWNCFCEELLSETDFEAVLATFFCYEYGANASEAVQNIARDQKELLVCSHFMNSQNITINQ